MAYSTTILLILLFMELGLNTKRSKQPDENSSLMPQKRKKIFQGPYIGARPRNGNWVAEIRIPKTTKRVWLGTHNTAEAAAQAYDDASLLLHGVDGPCNFPDNRRPVASIQMIGTKTIDKFRQIVKESTSPGTCKVLDSKSPSKLLSTSHSCDKPFVLDQLDHGEFAAHFVTPEPIVTTMMCEGEPYVSDQLDHGELAAHVVTHEPMVTTMMCEVEPYVHDQLNHGELAAHFVTTEPIVSTMMCEVEPYVPELDFTANKYEVEPYFPSFAPEEEPLTRDRLPVDEALHKGSDEWILNFLAETLTNND